MQDYRNLVVWQKAHQLTLRTYAISATLTGPTAWPLRDQLIRAAISVPSNIAEGAGRGTDSDFGRFVDYSLGSLNELEYDLLLARDLHFLQADEHFRICEQLVEVRRMLSGLRTQLKPKA
jgi:four helix bundle protein